MSREIKFRAWDNNKKIMYYDENSSFIFSSNKIECNFDNGWLTRNTGIFMQFTGLKDRNGKEIYEGDIVRVVDDPSHKYNIDMLRSDFGKKALVVWENRWASFGLSDGYDEALISKGGIGNLISSGFNCAEIIGNIYENPELLKG